MAGLTVRGKDQRWLSTHRNLTEQPAGSNRDMRQDGITAAQTRLGVWLVGQAWCGVWAANALLAAGVEGVTWRLAAVRLIQDDAKARRLPFRDWQPVSAWRKVLRGDLVTWFGGAHVETVRGFKRVNGQVFVITDGGNTSSGNAGSQSNGGGSFRRVRPLSQADGFARVDYPGGAVRRAAARVAMRLDVAGDRPDAGTAGVVMLSDEMLLNGLRDETHPDAVALRELLGG